MPFGQVQVLSKRSCDLFAEKPRTPTAETLGKTCSFPQGLLLKLLSIQPKGANYINATDLTHLMRNVVHKGMCLMVCLEMVRDA